MPEESISVAWAALAGEGIYVEPTSAIAWAARDRLGTNTSDKSIVVALSGSGLKLTDSDFAARGLAEPTRLRG